MKPVPYVILAGMRITIAGVIGLGAGMLVTHRDRWALGALFVGQILQYFYVTVRDNWFLENLPWRTKP